MSAGTMAVRDRDFVANRETRYFVKGMKVILLLKDIFYVTKEHMRMMFPVWKEKPLNCCEVLYFIISCFLCLILSLSCSHTDNTQIIEECNTQVGKMKQVEELIHLSKTLEFDKLKVSSHTQQPFIHMQVCVFLIYLTEFLFWTQFSGSHLHATFLLSSFQSNPLLSVSLSLFKFIS